MRTILASHPHTRTTLVSILTLVLTITTLSVPVTGQPVSTILIQQRLQSACGFLESLYRSDLQLVKTTATNPPNTFYIASDNLLARKALSYCTAGGSISNNITRSTAFCCGSGIDLMHESLLGTKISIPIHNATTYTIANSTAGKFWDSTGLGIGAYTVLWEVHNSTGILPDCVYGDVTVYTALELRLEGNNTGAGHEMDCLSIMWDGTGIVDEAYKDGTAGEHGVYQTFKLALYYLALHNITGSYYTYPGELDLLLRMQGPDGGFHTGYDKAGTYAGTQENAETTSIAIIALHTLSSPTTIFPSFSIPPVIIYTVIGVAVAGGAVATFLVWLLLLRKKPTASVPTTEPVLH